MSVVTDPSQVRLGDRPLIVCDIDEVVLEFLTHPSPVSFARTITICCHAPSGCTATIVSLLDSAEMDRDAFDRFHGMFFETQDLYGRSRRSGRSRRCMRWPPMPTSSFSPPCRRVTTTSAAGFSTGSTCAST